MAIKIKCSECKKMKWMNKNAVTCGNTCRSKRHRRVRLPVGEPVNTTDREEMK